ncbi:MAG: divalent-cation tolerance protein CutA [Verrucomicrobia bacterium]|nr:divalent-cation tolerance protein CutA [Verrucomicrobiota bacterium]
MLIAWTTVGTAAEADRLATEIVAGGLAACVQIDGPIVSHFRWEGRCERAEEFRLCIKLTASQLEPLQKYVLTAHPYDTPEWVVVRAAHVGEKYLSWANGTVHSPPL